MEMTTKEAISYIAENFDVASKYALAKMLSSDSITVQPIQITNYITGTKPHEKVAKRFLEEFGIVITDMYSPSDFRQHIRKETVENVDS